jgi:hypothetical protein
MTLGARGVVVSITTPCDSAAEYARLPSLEKVMSCDSVPSPGRVGIDSSVTFTGAAKFEMSNTSIAGRNEVIRSEFEL